MSDFAKIRKAAIDDTLKKLQLPVRPDENIIVAIKSIQDIDDAANILSRRLRRWYELYAPEVSFAIEDHYKFASTILVKDKKELLKETRSSFDTGGTLETSDLDTIRTLASQIVGLYKEKERLTLYIESLMEKHTPNLLALTTPLIGGKMLAKAGSLRKMALLASSAIQLLGAEDALFRHLKTKGKPPKYGVLFAHPIVNKLQAAKKGKAARQIANKITIAVKADFYESSRDVGRELLKKLEATYGKN
jgi:nucleolar protein 56